MKLRYIVDIELNRDGPSVDKDDLINELMDEIQGALTGSEIDMDETIYEITNVDANWENHAF